MRISDWSSDVCSSYLAGDMRLDPFADEAGLFRAVPHAHDADFFAGLSLGPQGLAEPAAIVRNHAAGRTENVRRRAVVLLQPDYGCARKILFEPQDVRSEEHTSELQSLMRNSYAGFCLNKKT